MGTHLSKLSPIQEIGPKVGGGHFLRDYGTQTDILVFFFINAGYHHMEWPMIFLESGISLIMAHLQRNSKKF